LDILDAKIAAENAPLCDLQQDFSESKKFQNDLSITIENLDLSEKIKIYEDTNLSQKVVQETEI
jgi:hypothetical protein